MELADVLASVRRHWQLSVALVVVVLAALVIFIFTSEDVTPSNRFTANETVIIPAPDPEDGTLPEGVPTFLLRDPLAPAEDGATRGTALDNTDLGDVSRGAVRLSAGGNESLSNITLRAEAPEPEVAESAADAYSRAFVSARKDLVAENLRGGARGARNDISVFSQRRGEIEAELRSQGLALPAIAPQERQDATGDNQDGPPPPGVDEETTLGPAPTLDIPSGVSEDTRLLYLERNELANRVDVARAKYADAITAALTPRSYSERVAGDDARPVTEEPLNPLIPIGAALAAALLLAVGVPVLVERFDRSIKDAGSAGTSLSAPVLSAIPATPRGERPGLAAPGSAQASAYRSLATLSVATDRLPRSIMVTAPTGHSQDAVAVNFAAALAGIGLRVALVATSPRQAWYLAGDGDQGALALPEMLARANRAQLNGEVQDRLATTEIANLFVIPPADNEGPLPLDGLPPLLDALENDAHDVTVLAGPAILDDPDATIMAWSTRSVLWALPTGEISDAEAQEAAGRLELAGVRPFGIAMIGRSV